MLRSPIKIGTISLREIDTLSQALEQQFGDEGVSPDGVVPFRVKVSGDVLVDEQRRRRGRRQGAEWLHQIYELDAEGGGLHLEKFMPGIGIGS